jgi:hypothetical protein
MKKKGVFYILIFLFLGISMLAACGPTETLDIDSLEIIAENQYNVPAGTYTLPYTIEDLEQYAEQFDVSVVVTVIDSSDQVVNVAENVITVIAGEVYTVTVKVYQGETEIKSITFTVTAVEPDVKTPESISVTSLPMISVYTEGDSFTPTGMQVTVYYSDDTSELTEEYTLSVSGPLTPEDETITVTHTLSGLTTTFNITVNTQMQIDVYTVTFNANGGTLSSGSAEQSIIKGGDATAPVYSDRKGYYFIGFDIDYTNVQADITVNALWVNLEQGSNQLSYDLSNDYSYYTVSSYWGTDINLVIPSIYLGLPVKEIASSAFYNNTSVIRLFISESIISIGPNAMDGMSSLKEIIVDEDNDYFASEGGILYDNSVKTVVRCPEGRTDALSIPETVTTLAYQAFFNTLITDITFPDSLISVGRRCFYGSEWLEMQEPGLITAGAVAIGYKGTIPEELSIPDGIRGIGDSAFDDAAITSISLPASLLSIGNYSFSDCELLTSIVLPEQLTTIGFGAFYYCTNLSDITFSDSTYMIQEMAFSYTAWLDDQADGEVYAGKVFYLYKGTMPQDTSIELQSDTLGIAGGAFADRDELVRIILPENITAIGDNAFINCHYLPYVILPESVEYVGNNAFYMDDSALLTIYARAESEPLTWNANWNRSERPVIWGLDVAHYEFETYGGTAVQGLMDDTLTILPETYKENYIFIGWFNNAECDGEPIEAPYYSKSNTVLYAGWEHSYLVFYLNGSQIMITGLREGYSGTTLTIPETLDYYGMDYPVTAIGENAFADRDTLIEVYIPETIRSINTGILAGCDFITKLSVALGADIAGRDDFISYYFGGEDYLDNYTVLPSSLIEVNVLAPVTDISNNAFMEANNIQKIVLPEGVMTLGYNAFNSCEALNNINLPSGLSMIHDFAFYESGISSIEVPGSVGYIGKYAFAKCPNLQFFKILNAYTDIRQNILNEDNALLDVTLPFSSTQNDIAMYFDDEAGSDNGLPDTLTTLRITTGVTAIPNECIMYSSNIEIVYLPNGLTKIGANAFNGCLKLEVVFLPENNSLNRIEDFAFYNCSKLYGITVPESVEYIGQYAFANCTDMLGFSVLNNDAYIYFGIIKGCTGLMGISVPLGARSAEYLGYYFGGEIVNDKPDNSTIPESLITVTVISGATIIDEYAFYECTNIETVNLPEGITRISQRAFYACESLSYVYLPSSLCYIDEFAFIYCDSLEYITLNEGLSTIGSSAFSYCFALAAITIPSSVTYISDNAFARCTSLEVVHIERSIPDITDSSLYLFIHCEALTHIYVPEDSVTAYKAATGWSDYVDLIYGYTPN